MTRCAMCLVDADCDWVWKKPLGRKPGRWVTVCRICATQAYLFDRTKQARYGG